MRGLTNSQQAVLEFLVEHIAQHGHAPTHQEICERFNWTSASYPQRRLKALEKKGFIKIKPRVIRGIELYEERVRNWQLLKTAKSFRQLAFISARIFA